jgi:Clp amino terminal domain, pathogenicity island component
MKSTTVRFADPVYGRLELASRMTGLPINSIVTVACLQWLRQNTIPEFGMPMLRQSMPRQAEQLDRMVELTGAPLAGADPLWIFTAAAQETLGHAHEEAERTRQPWIGTEQLLHGLYAVEGGRAGQALRRLDLDVDALLQGGEPEEAGGGRGGRLLPTRQVRRVLKRAHEESEREKAAQVGTDHLLLGLLLDGDSRAASTLEAAGATHGAVRDALTDLPPET